MATPSSCIFSLRSSLGSARFFSAIRSPGISVWMFTPSCSNRANITAASSKVKPSERSGEPNWVISTARSSSSIPVVWVKRNRRSSVGPICLVATDQSPNKRVIEATLSWTSVPVTSESAVICFAIRVSGPVARSVRRARPATASEAVSKSVGTDPTTSLKTPWSFSNSLPVAPVWVRMLSNASSKSLPMSNNILPTPAAANPPASATPAAFPYLPKVGPPK